MPSIYSTLNDMRQGFEQVFSAMDRLNASGLSDRDLFDGCRLLTEEAAAWACHQVVEALRDREVGNWASAGRRWTEWQKNIEIPSATGPQPKTGTRRHKPISSQRAKKEPAGLRNKEKPH